MDSSPTPWKVVAFEPDDLDQGSWYEIRDCNDQHVETMIDEEDARRIVACVNACAGIDDDTLEAGALVRSSQLYQMTKERDKLHAALCAVRQAFRDNDTSRDKAHPWIPGADAPRVIRIIEEALKI